MPTKINKTTKPVVKVIHRQFEGEVIKVGNKTIQVAVKLVKVHEKYHKQFFKTTKFAVHDEKGLAKEADLVLIEECRPLSRTKRCRLVKVIKSQTN